MATTPGVLSQHGQPSVVGTLGAHHTAYPCWDPAETLRLYHEVLGFQVPHCIPARGWGMDDNPDMVHFFFDIGNGDTLAFFYYFGYERPPRRPGRLHPTTHIAIEVADQEALYAFRDRLTDAGYDVMTVEHETIESIYFDDPNDVPVEFTYPRRAIEPLDAADAMRSMEALREVVSTNGDTSIQDVWRVKAQRRQTCGAPAIHVVDVPEWRPAIEYARNNGYRVTATDGYVVIQSGDGGPLEIGRKAAGMFPAVWYTLPAGGLEGTITRFDRDILRVEA